MELGASFAAFLVLTLGGWLVFNFATKIIAFFLSRVTGNEVHFVVISPIKLKDLSITLKKGPIEYISVGEIGWSLRESLSPVLKRGGALKAHLAVRDVEILLRPAVKSKKKKKSAKRPSSERRQQAGSTVWWLLSKVAALLHVSVTEVVFTSTKIANVSLHMKLLDFDIQRLAEGRLGLRLESLPWHILICKSPEEQKSRLRSLLSLLSGSEPSQICVPLVVFESLVVDSTVGFEKDTGVCLQQVGVTCGELAVTLDEHLAWLELETRTTTARSSARSDSVGKDEVQHLSNASLPTDQPASLSLLEEEVLRSESKPDKSNSASNDLGDPLVVDAAVEQAASALQNIAPAAESPRRDGKSADTGPRKVRLPDMATFELPALRVSWAHGSLNHVLESSILGLRVEAKGTQSDAPAGPQGLLEVQCHCGAFELLRGTDMVLVDITRSAMKASVQVPSSKEEPIRAAVDVKLGGAACNVSPNLDPWLAIALNFAKSLQGRRTSPSDAPKTSNILKPEQVEGPQNSKPAPEPEKAVKPSKLVWDVAFSAPESVLVLYGPLGAELLKVTTHSAHMWVAASGPKVLEANCEFDELLFHLAESEAVRRSIKRLSSDPLLLSSGSETQFAKLMRFRHLEVQWGLQGLEKDEHANGGDLGMEELRTVQIEVEGGALFLDAQQVQTLVREADKAAAYAKQLLGKSSSRNPTAKKQSSRKKRPAVEQVRLSLEAFVVEYDKVMEFRVTSVEGNPKSDGRPDLAQVVPVYIQRASNQKSPRSEPSASPRKETSGPALPCNVVLRLGKVLLQSHRGILSSKLERCQLEYREEGLPNDFLINQPGVSGQQDEKPSGKSSQQQRRTSEVSTLDPTADRTATLFDIQTANLVYHKGAEQEGKPARVYVSACGVDAAWEADAHLFLHAVSQDVKEVLDRQKEARNRAKRASTSHEPDATNMSSSANGPQEESASLQAESSTVEQAEKETSQETRQASHQEASTSKPLSMLVHVDLEMLNLGADMGLGWQGFLRAQSVFSEDASIGVLLEGLQAGLNDAVVFSSESLQLSRHAAVPKAEEEEGEALPAAWDLLVQGQGTCISMPFRMALREAEDAGEDLARALKYIVLAMKQKQAWYRTGASTEPNKKKKKRKSIGTVRLAFKDFQADVEDEPFQSWLDLHYRLLSKQVKESMVREKLLAEKVGEAAAKELMQEARSFILEQSGTSPEHDANLLNPALAREAWERVMRQASRAYKEECTWRLNTEGFQEKSPGAGGQRSVKVSKGRENLVTVSVTSLNVVVTEIENGTEGMTKRVREMDSVRPGRGVPFSRFYGRHTTWEAAGLRVQIRDYSVPLLAAASGTAEGDMIFAQQATVVPPLVWQELPVGRWQIVRMLRSASGCTPPLKLYTDLSVDLKAAEVGAGTGFEPAYADISYAFTTAIKKAPSPGADVIVPSTNSTPRTTPRASEVERSEPLVQDLAVSSVPFPQQDSSGGLGTVELLTGGNVPIIGLQGTSATPKERSLPWWDLMRYYIHGHQKVVFHDLELALLGTTDPYEEEQMLLLSASTFEVNSCPGAVTIEAGRVSVNLTSGGVDAGGSAMDSGSTPNDVNNLAQPVRCAQLQSPIYQVDFTMGWDCHSGQPLMHYLHAMPWEGVIRQQVNDPFRSTSLRLGIEMKFCEEPEVQDLSKSSPPVDRPRRNTADPLAPEAPKWARVHSNSESALPQSRLARSHSLAGEALSRRRSNASSAAEEEDFPSSPTISLGAPDFLFIRNWWSMWYYPPMKLRSFARCPRFGVPRGKRSGNLGLDKVLVELMLKIDSTPCCYKHVSVGENDPAEGLTFQMSQLKYDCCWYRAPIDEQTASILGVDYRGSIPRGDLLGVYQAFDARTVRVFLDYESSAKEQEEQRRFDKLKQLMDLPDSYRGESISEEPGSAGSSSSIKFGDDKGFLLSTDSFSLRKQSPKADNRRLATWRVGPRAATPMFSLSGLSAASDSDYGSGVSGSEEEEGLAVVLADNCLRVALHGLKLLWTLPNRDAVWSWVHDMTRGFSSPKPSPSKQYAQRKKMEEHQRLVRWRQNVLEIPVSPTPSEQSLNSVVGSLATSSDAWGLNPVDKPMNPELQKEANTTRAAAAGAAQNTPMRPALAKTAPVEEGEGEMKFMINVTQPQFNLHSENARGRFLLAAASGRVLARSFHEAVVLGLEALAGAPEMRGLPLAGGFPIITWRKRELSVLLEHVQAHVAPTDVDLNAGIQWLPKVQRDGRSNSNAKQPGSLLERVFTPCTMVFQYTRHRGGQGDGKGKDAKSKPLKHFQFTSPDISASMTSRQFSILMDVITSLLLARLPRARDPPLRWGSYAADEEADQEEEADEVVPEGIDEVELARIEIEALDRECTALAQDLRHIRSQGNDEGQAAFNVGLKGNIDKDLKLWMVTSARYALVRRLELLLGAKKEAKSEARRSLRKILKAAAAKHQQQLKHPSSALRISWMVDKGMWTMLADNEPFAEAEISNMILDLDRDFDDVGFARFTIKHLTIRNCSPHPKCKEILDAWNPPAEWGKGFMLKVEAKQGAPELNGVVPILHFQVEIHPLRIYLTEGIYKMLFDYIFPKDEYTPFSRQEAWRQQAALPPSGSNPSKTRGRRKSTAVETGDPVLTRQSSGDSLKSPHSPKPSLPSLSVQPPSWATSNFGNASPGDLDPELMAEVSKVSHTRQPSSSGYSSGESFRTAKHRRTASAIDFGSNDSALLEAVVAQPHSAGRAGSYSGPLAMTAQTLGQGTGLLQVPTAAILAAAANEGSGSSDTTPPGKKRRKVRLKQARQSEEEVAKSKALVIHFIKIAQVELVASYEGSPISFSEKRFLMDTFSREHFTGDWKRLFVKVKKHIIWGVLKSVAGVQGKKFRQAGGEIKYGSESGSESSDQGGRQAAGPGQPIGGEHRKRFQHSGRSSEGFVSSVKGLFNAQRRKAKAIMRRSQRASPSSLSAMEDDPPSDGSDGSSHPTASPSGRSFRTLLRQSSMRRSITKKTSPLFSKARRESFEETSPTSQKGLPPRSPGIPESPSTTESSPSTSTHGPSQER